jgi:DnaJ-class molecular chaperone
MMDRLDVRPGGPCAHCDGKGTDPKKRKRPCPVCHGSKVKLVCESCGEDMPCSGTRDDILDQTYCMKGETDV